MLLDITDIVLTDNNEDGLFSIAFPPDYATSGRFYVFFSDRDSDETIMRFRVSDDPNRADHSSGELILCQPDRLLFHNGGSLAFGPDGYLYLGIGDGGGPAIPTTRRTSGCCRQDTAARRCGGELRGSRRQPVRGNAWRRGEIWAYGLRNPWRISFDRATGDLYIADVGQDYWEEINYQPAGQGAGANFGWRIVEGDACYPRDVLECDRVGLTSPVFTYVHDFGCAVVGGNVYRGRRFPSLFGTYLAGDFCSGRSGRCGKKVTVARRCSAGLGACRSVRSARTKTASYSSPIWMAARSTRPRRRCHPAPGSGATGR